MILSKTAHKNLVNRLDDLSAEMRDEIAISFIANGDPQAPVLDISFTEFAAQVRQRAGALVELGIGPNDIITFAAPLDPLAFQTMLACMAVSTIAPINYFLETDALEHIVAAQSASTLLVHRNFSDGPEVIEKLKAVHHANPQMRLIVFGEGPSIEGALDLDLLAAKNEPDDWPEELRERETSHVMALFHTGGTTGLPKLVPHTEAMYSAMVESCGKGEGAQPGETMISGLPLFHTGGALQSGLVPLLNGTRVLIPSSQGFRNSDVIANYWQFVTRFQVSLGAGVPTILAALSANKPTGDISSFKRFIVGGAPISKATIGKISEMTAGAEVIEGWGMTETSGFSVMNPSGKTRLGSVGLPFDGVEIQIRQFSEENPLGRQCPPDEVGELVVRGDIVISNYHTSRPDCFSSDGWLRTGDLGRIDADGYLWITGRLKDVIIRGGHNIDPSIIEEPAYSHPSIQLAAAVGKPDKYAGELPVIFVQLKPNSQLDEDAFLEFLRKRIVERAAIPKDIFVIKEMPVSGPGKILKTELRRHAISQVFQFEIDSLSLEGSGIIARTEVDSLAGEIVELECSDGFAPDSETKERVSETLSGFTTGFRWKETVSA